MAQGERGPTNRLAKHKTLASAVVREERDREAGAFGRDGIRPYVHAYFYLLEVDYMICAV